jgi:peroxiredoxin
MPKQLAQNISAPDFELVDTQDRSVRLSDYLNKAPVVLVFLRGFI